MRKETKIGILILLSNLLLAHIITLPQFVGGLLTGLSIFFIIIGILSEKAYLRFKKRQARKFTRIRSMVGIH